MLLEVERDKAITDRVILLQKVIRGFKDRYARDQLLPMGAHTPLSSNWSTKNTHAHPGAHLDMSTRMHNSWVHTDTRFIQAHTCGFRGHTHLDTLWSQMPDDISQRGNSRFYKLQIL